MFVIRISLVLIVASMFAEPSEAQLFRFRANPIYDAQQYAQRYGYPSGYDARNYQYNQVQPRANYVPSQRYGTQPQTPTCGCAQTQNRTALVPANSPYAIEQQRLQAQQRLQPQQRLAQQSRVVVATYRDPNSGRLFQRRYLVQQPTAQQNAFAQQQFRQPTNLGDAATHQSPNQLLSVVNPIGVSAPKLDTPSDSGTVATTSFDSPILEPTPTPSDEFSVLSTGDNEETTSVLETSLPLLEAPATSPETPGSLLDTENDLDLDLPPLSLDDTN